MRFARPSLNPVLRRELVERWRAQRAVWALTGYLSVLGLLLYVLYRAGYSLLDSQLRFGFGEVDPAVAGPMLGRFLVEGLLFFMLVLVLFVAPGYAAAQLSGERERRTLALLQVTLLRPVQIVLGKLGASVAWVTLLVVAALPLGAAAFFLGGVGLGQLLRGLGFVVAVGVSVAALALGISSLTRRTTGAVVLTYGVVLALTGGTLFASAVEFVVRSNAGFGAQPTPVALYANPFVGLADAIYSDSPEGMFAGPLPSPLGMIAAGLQRSAMIRGGGMVMEARPMPMPMADMDAGFVIVDDEFAAIEAEPVPDILVEDPVFEPMPFPQPEPIFEQPGRRLVWPIVLAVYVALGLAGLAVATLRLRTTRVTLRRHRTPQPPAPAEEPAS